MRTRILLTLVITALYANNAASATLPRGIDCLIHPNMTVEISSPVSGVVEKIDVDRSDAVKQDDILARLTSDVEKERFEAARIKAEFGGALESARVNLKLAEKEYKRAAKLFKDRAIPLAEKERAKASLDLARQEHINARHLHHVRKVELNEARANLELRQIRSPIDGIVVERYMTPGEFVDSRPVLKIAQLNPLRIEIITPASYFDDIKTGMHAHVQPEYGKYDDLVAQVMVVDKVIDAASGTFGVRLQLDNEGNRVPGGLKCKLNFFTELEETTYHKQQLTDEGVNDSDSSELPNAQLLALDDTSTVQHCATISSWRDRKVLDSFIEAHSQWLQDVDVQQVAVTDDRWLVVSDGLDDLSSAKSMQAKLAESGFHDVAILNHDGEPKISAGLYSKESKSKARVIRLHEAGFSFEAVPYEIRSNAFSASIVTRDKTMMEKMTVDLDKSFVVEQIACEPQSLMTQHNTPDKTQIISSVD